MAIETIRGIRTKDVQMFLTQSGAREEQFGGIREQPWLLTGFSVVPDFFFELALFTLF